jgi:hypothetical protein
MVTPGVVAPGSEESRARRRCLGMRRSWLWLFAWLVLACEPAATAREAFDVATIGPEPVPTSRSTTSRSTTSRSTALPTPAGVTARRPSSSFAAVEYATVASNAPPDGFLAAAARCSSNPACTMDRRAEWLLAAVDAGEADVPCFAFLRGVGVPVDAVRARRCLERQVRSEGDCGGSSPSLARLQLAILRGAGAGGSLQTVSALSLFDGCFGDASVSEAHSAIGAYARDGDWRADGVHVCDAGLAQTTLHMVRCMALSLGELEVRATALDKAVHARWGAGLGRRFRRVSLLHTRYAGDTAQCVGARFGGGSMEPLQIFGAELGARRQRLERWEALTRSDELDVPSSERAHAELLAERKNAFAAGPPATIGRTWSEAEWRARLADNEQIYAPYRAMELALLDALPEGRPVVSLLDSERAKDLSMLMPL